MSMPVILAMMFTLAALGGLLLAHWRDRRVAVWIFKPLASIGFCVTAVCAGALERGLWGMLILAALILSLGGDILLIPHGKRTLLFGMFAFLGAHVCFAAAFVARGIDWRWSAAAALPVALLLLFIGRSLLPRVEASSGARMRAPVLIYMVVVSLMVVLAAGTRGNWLLPVSAMAFYLSDVSVAIDRFVHRAFVNRLWGLPLYYGAQLLFALSLGHH